MNTTVVGTRGKVSFTGFILPTIQLKENQSFHTHSFGGLAERVSTHGVFTVAADLPPLQRCLDGSTDLQINPFALFVGVTTFIMAVASGKATIDPGNKCG